MADHYEDYTREQLMRLLRERDEIANDASVNGTIHQHGIKKTDVSYWLKPS
jgi:hypothetical protein